MLRWRNKPQRADPCVATLAHKEQVRAVAVTARYIVGGAGRSVFVYDAAPEERRGELEGASDVQSVAGYRRGCVAGRRTLRGGLDASRRRQTSRRAPRWQRIASS